MKKKINVNILPTFKTNKVNEYTKFDHTDNSVGDLVIYDDLLEKLSVEYEINGIKISGGEISNLSDLYFDFLYNIVKLHSKNISVYTNFETFNKALINGIDIIDVEYNFTKENKEIVFKNIKAAIQIGKIININAIDIACTYNYVEDNIDLLNKLNIKSFEILPFQPTKYTKAKYKKDQSFDNIVLDYVNYSYQMNFAFKNKLQLDGILPIQSYNTFTVYLTPHNKYATAKYTKDNKMYLQEFDTIEELYKDLDCTYKKQEEYCNKCKVKLKCLANEYKNFDRTDGKCCGFSDLLYTYSKEKDV